MKISPICFSACSMSAAGVVLCMMLQRCHANEVERRNAEMGGLHGIWNVVSGKQSEEIREDEGYTFVNRVLIGLVIATGIVGSAAREKGA